MEYKTLLTQLTDGKPLAAAEMQEMMRGILSGEWTPAQTAGALVALKIKGETPDEIVAAASVMRELAAAVAVQDTDNLVDTCGTGGDNSHTFNISTTAMFVAAACGVRIAKHGNRAMSGSSGSSDVLEALGMPLTLSPPQVAATIESVGIGFMFAPVHHAAMKYAAPVRRELGVRTLFNLLGPLSNPAGAKRQLIGVFAADLLLPYAESLAALGAKQALVAHGQDGLDEISISAATDIAELQNGAIVRSTLEPESLGLKRAPLSDIQVNSVDESKTLLQAVLNNSAGAPRAARDIVLLNTAAILKVAGAAADWADGINQAAQAIDSGKAQEKLQEFINATQTAAAAAGDE